MDSLPLVSPNPVARRRRRAAPRTVALSCLGFLLAWAASPAAAGHSPVAGKVVCLDPGHGGSESGAVGPNGVREKDVNLAVALRLKTKLEAAGGIVALTRTGDETLSIAQRGRINRAHNSDLFVSIHHNANAQADSTMNRTEVFWHWHDDGGPSEDAARALLRELEATLRLPGSKAYLCWAYGVMRENRYPAVLVEAYYLSHPAEAARALDPEYVETQAAALFRGIESFFRGGRPEVRFMPGHDASATRIAQALLRQTDGLSLPDPARVRLQLDGRPVPSYLFFRADVALLFAALPKDDAAGTRTLTLAVRNLAGRTSFVESMPVSAGPDRTPPAPPPQARSATTQVLGAPVPPPAGASDAAPPLPVPPPVPLPVPLPGAYLIGQQIRSVFGVADAEGRVRLDAAERLTPEPHVVHAVGYWSRDVHLAREPEPVLEPMFRGVLHGKRIVVDAAGGGDDPVAVGANGLRAADANLETALYLAEFLRQAGADVALTRDTDRSMDNVARVRFGLERDPALFLTVGYRLPEPGLGERPGQLVSRVGSRWDGGRAMGADFIFHLRHLLGTGTVLGDPTSRAPLSTEVHNWSSWEVMHGAQNYTAVHVSPWMFDGPGVQARLSTTAGTRKAAQAIFHGLLDHLGLDDRAMAGIDGRVVDAATGEPLADALVWLDETLVVQTEADGRFAFRFLDPGPRRLRTMRAAYRMVSTTLELHENRTAEIRVELTPSAPDARRPGPPPPG